MASLRERAERGVPVGDLLEAVLSETGYVEALEAERTFEAQGRIENLEQLVEAAREFDARGPASGEGEATLDTYLQETMLRADADDRRDDEGLVTLMTLHNAKGLEYPIVFMIGCEEGVFPHSRSVEEGNLEEERRLCYVGITRAERCLYLSYALHRRIHGYGVGEPSRFLHEMPEEQLAFINVRREPDAGTFRENGVPSAPRVVATEDWPINVGARVRHARFGEGLVVGIERDGSDFVVTVGFASVGRKRLSVQYAHLEEL
jgi:DNA helicase-2/ATP-dependent DNA helicase PcrA